ncbi:MAG: YggT family protein [Acinetobacter sp.]|nr:YggT family protein [Acinetobacter sp.]
MLSIATILINFALILLFVRFLTQLAQIDRFNAVVIALNKATAFLDVMAKAIPHAAKGKVNLSALVLIVLLYLAKMMVLAQFAPEGQGIYSIEHLVILTFVTMIEDLIDFCRLLIFAAILLSWVTMFSQSRSAYIDFVQDLAEPLFAPFRRILPNTGMIDLAPIAAILALILAENIMQSVSQFLLAGF